MRAYQIANPDQIVAIGGGAECKPLIGGLAIDRTRLLNGLEFSIEAVFKTAGLT
jgi:hypothetical protein